MKPIYSLLKACALFILVLGLSSGLSAQKATSEKVTFDYTKAPKLRFDRSIKTYHVEVSAPYQVEYEEKRQKRHIQRQEYEAKKKAYEEGQLATPPQALTAADHIPSRDDFPAPERVILKVNAENMEKVESGGLKVIYEFQDYDFTTDKENTGGDGNRHVKLLMFCAQPTKLIVKDPSGAVLFDELIKGTDKKKKSKGDRVPSEDYLEWESTVGKDLIKLSKVEARDRSIEIANEELTDLIGYSKGSFEVDVFSGKGKGDYAELDKAEQLAVKGLRGYKEDYATSKNLFQDCINIWEKELESLNTGDKKARINTEIGAGLYLNIALVSILTRDFERANNVLIKLESDGELKKELKRDRKSLLEFYEDERVRHPFA